MRKSIISLAALALSAGLVHAETVAITNAHIYSMGKAGEIASGTVVLKDGKFVSVGANKAPDGARIIDAAGRIVTPGMIVTGSAISAGEIGGVEQTNDQGVADGPLSAGLDIQYSLNPDSTMIPIIRLTGTTGAIVTPELRSGRRHANEKLFAGQAAAIQLGGDQLLTRAHVAMVTEAGERGAAQAGGSRSAFITELRSALDEARSYAHNRAAYEQNRVRPMSLSKEDLEALIPVVEGREPLLVSVHRASDIRQILDFAKAQKLSLILSGVEEGWRVASEIAAAKVPVIIDSDEDLPGSFETLSSSLENAARMTAAGVSVTIHGPEINNGGKAVRLAAGRASAYGLPWGAALASVTINPARAFGLADRTGSIDPGKDADLVLWDGDPLDTSGAPSAIFIKGVQQPMRSRDLDLRDRYLQADDGMPKPYH
jgi:imidazolonepropionase-like amidohydrolase